MVVPTEHGTPAGTGSSRPTDKAPVQAQPRESTTGADYLNTYELFSQTPTQEIPGAFLDAADTAEEQKRIQQNFRAAISQHKDRDRRSTFGEVAKDYDDASITTDEGWDDNETLPSYLSKLDEGPDRFKDEANARPQYVYDLMGKLCGSLHLLQHQVDLLHQSNDVNKNAREALTSELIETRTQLEAATTRINTLPGRQPRLYAPRARAAGKAERRE